MNIIFDFDGTICDSFQVVLETANKYLTKTKLQTITADDVREKGITKLIKEYKLNKLQMIIFVYKGHHEFSKFLPFLKTFPRMKPVLKSLSHEHTLGIISTNSTKNVSKFLRENDLDKYFKFVKSNSNLFGKDKTIQKIISTYKWHKSDTYYVGDETRDTNAAKKAGVKSVAVTWGYESKKLLSTSQPDFILTSPKELLSLGK